MTERNPDRAIRELFRFVDKPVDEEEDIVERAEREEDEAFRKERDADFEVVDDLDDDLLGDL